MLTIRPLATLLGVSAMPVREAISRLVADEVLEPLRNRAFRLPVLDLQTFGSCRWRASGWNRCCANMPPCG